MLVPFYKPFYVFLFILSAFCSRSQDFAYKHYDVQDGLPNPTIHAIFQDRDGFLWIGTESGLCRYDGTRFKTFTVEDGLPGNEVLGVFQDSRGRIWLQFYKNSIAYIYNGKIHNQQNDTLLKKITLSQRLHGIAEDADGNIGFTDVKSVLIISRDDRIIKKIESPDGRSLNIMGIYTSGNGKFIACDTHSLFKIENGQLIYLKTLSAKQDLSQNGVLLHRNYYTYMYADSVYLRDTAVRFSIDKYNMIKYSPVADSILSVNTPDGAYLFYINDCRTVKLLPGIKVSNVFMDREKNIWLGTISNGMYKLSSQAIVNKKIEYGQNDIWYIAKENDKIFAGNNNSRVYEYSKDSFARRNIGGEEIFYYWKIIHHELLKDGGYLLAHSMGVLNYGSPKQALPKLIPMLKHVSSFDENHLIFSAHAGLVIVRKNDLTVTDTIWRQKAISSLKTSDSILAGTTAGLYILKERNNRYSLSDSLLPSSNIVNIKKTANNLIWICSYENGLYCLGNGKILRHFTKGSGLPSDNGRTLYVHDNDVWMGTDKGVVKIKIQDGNFHVQKYSTSDGLPSDIINSIFVDEGTIYIGTPEGLCVFNEKLIETTSICNLVVTGISIGDSLVDFRNKYFLRAKQRFTIEFSGISLRSEQEMTYRYKIHGMDDNWRITTLNSLEFTALPYGDYELEIVAINKFGKESAPSKIAFNVVRPFHKTIWFILMMVLVPVSVILLLYNRRTNRIKQKQVQKLQQEIKIIKLEQMALRAQMNPHFIFNCISAIPSLVAEKNTENASRFITSFSDLVRQTLDNATELVIPLNEEIKFLTNYLELERIRLEDRFSYAINTTGIKNIDHLQIPNMVIQPFVENAVRHGIRYKKNGKGFIEVLFEQSNETFCCTITDNGIGREKAGQMRKESGILHASKGIGITFKRIESLNTLMNGKIYIAIEDLRDEMGEASGTKVKIEFRS